jgi:hypothetical protein
MERQGRQGAQEMNAGGYCLNAAQAGEPPGRWWAPASSAVARLMRRQARQHGLDLSVRVLLSELAGIQETVLLYPSTAGRPRARRMLTEMTLTQQRRYQPFGLDRYAPAR